MIARLEAGYEYDPMYGELCNERDGLKAENAKLRELAKDALHELDKAEPSASHGWFWEAASELGIEAGE